MVLYEVSVKKRLVDFAWMGINNINHTIKVLIGKKYDSKRRMRKDGLLYLCHLMRIFEHFSFSVVGYSKVTVNES